MSTTKTFGFTALIGSSTGSMDAVDGDDLNDRDRAIVFYNGDFYAYELDASSGATAAPPNIIAPATNPGTKRWILQSPANTSNLEIGETSTTAHRGDHGKTAYDHSQITSGNPHSVSKSDLSLDNVANLDTSTTANITDSTDKRFVTDAQKTVIENTSGTNTGDQDLSGYATESYVDSALGGVQEFLITTPTITSPATGATDFVGEVTTSDFATVSSFYGTHSTSHWQAASDADFTTILDESTSGNLTSWTPSIGLALTLVYVRVRYGSDNHWSDWSSTVSFTTPDIYIETPSITSHTDGDTDIVLTPTITTSAFSVFNGSDTHASTDWQIATDSGFSSIVWQSLADTTNKTSITVPGGELSAGTQYYIRAKHNGTTYGSSAYASLGFTTDEVDTPSITSPTPDATGVTPGATITASAFSNDTSDTHQKTDWEIATDAGFSTVIFSSYNDTSNKTSIVPTGLSPNTEYYVRVRYYGTTLGASEYSTGVHYTTANIYVETPTLSVPGASTDEIAETPTLTTSAFSVANGSDTHASTDWVIRNSTDTTTVWSSMTDTTNKVSIDVPSGVLDEDTEYIFKARHNGLTYGSSAYDSVTGSTATSFLYVYGVRYDKVNDTIAPGVLVSGAFVESNYTDYPIQDACGRGLLTSSGGWSKLKSTDSTKLEDGSPATIDGSAGQVMVRIPRFYQVVKTVGDYQYFLISLSSFTFDGTAAWVPPAFADDDYRYIGAFMGVAATDSVDATILSAVKDCSGYSTNAYPNPATNRTRAQFRSQCAAYGGGFHQFSWGEYELIRILFLTKYKTWDSQDALPGYTEGAWDYANASQAGLTLSLGDADGSIDNGSGLIIANSFLGIENIFGNVFVFLDGINIDNTSGACTVYVCNDPDAFADDTATGYTATGHAPAFGGVSDYQKYILGSGEYCPFYPSTIGNGADSASYQTDYHWDNAGGWRVLLCGGRLSTGAQAGLAVLSAINASSDANSRVSVRSAA